MTIEFEFYFEKVEIGDGTVRVAAVTAITEYLDKGDGIELVEVVDWDTEYYGSPTIEGVPGIYCVARVKGEESDLKDLIYQHLDIIEDPDFAKDAAWNDLVTIMEEEPNE